MESLVWIYFIGISIVVLCIGYTAISFLVYVMGIPLIVILNLIGLGLMFTLIFAIILNR